MEERVAPWREIPIVPIASTLASNESAGQLATILVEQYIAISQASDRDVRCRAGRELLAARGRTAR
jgi:hypothetical protein